MTAYIETQSDAAFTLWLASLTPSRVMRERHAHMSKPERKILRYLTPPAPKRVPKPVRPPRQEFTQAQMDIALAAQSRRDNETRK